ncbi:AAA family ATPase [Leptothoe kymatousa]|uniref:AAA+ ATPase domain-containing protein n=1 Tax=Leptothoe kymatousa TAU-MAC 1615 TaxID=2364775 RepID=A0ABS5Y4K9_9CYAN|nr:AAA family ATPase [Leptothoe kymatousa]MBT9312556.1 hypothetical protein [Leptothoe kymatousa TAU-MAC 1615]
MVVTFEMLRRCEEPQRLQHRQTLYTTSIGGLVLSSALTIAACLFQGTGQHWGRTGMLLMAAPSLAAAKVASDELTANARDREDKRDVHTQARQDNLYKLLTQQQVPPDAPTEPEPPTLGSIEHPRQDWQPLFTELFAAKNSDGSFLYPCVFLTGRQGSGKTTFLKYIQQLLTGEIVVIDSHYKAGNWAGVNRIIGKAQDYPGIEAYLKTVSAEVKERYQIYSTVKGATFEPVTIIAEEMTNWDGHIDKDVAKTFMKGSLSDFRKVNYRLISVAHADTNTARGDAKGTAKLRANGEVRIELIQKGLAHITMPGTDEPFYLAFPNLAHQLPPGPQPPTPPPAKQPIPPSNVVEFTQGNKSDVAQFGGFTAQDAIATIADYLERKSITEPITIGRVRSQIRVLKEIPNHGWAIVLDGLRNNRLDTGALNVVVNGETIKVSIADANAA